MASEMGEGGVDGLIDAIYSASFGLKVFRRAIWGGREYQELAQLEAERMDSPTDLRREL